MRSYCAISNVVRLHCLDVLLLLPTLPRCKLGILRTALASTRIALTHSQYALLMFLGEFDSGYIVTD